ncbi:uncharacterized protein LOC114193652 isoform X1 [Vigna unguiculata]|uniref:uncharacterized protein LOC114193652 isoform X1 n=1 Tax=Vigna unguiculata TaxID=3917 RepID=UPI001015F1F0|nr:uncharacterized protein LOC114193652 isoform X1 [Vigna unguiculata]
MEGAVAASSLSLLSLGSVKTRSRVSRISVVSGRQGCNVWVKNGRRRRVRVSAVNVEDITTVLDPAPVEVTWQIVVGAIAGVTPFVVAGIEFRKRIIAQQRCEECGGSGLVLREKEYFRCPECGMIAFTSSRVLYSVQAIKYAGGFLPWQSWKRFFSG